MTESLNANADPLCYPREWLLMTLACIGDAVVTTDGEGKVNFLNPVAESLTGWTQEAVGHPLGDIIRLLNEESRQAVEIPTVQALQQGRTHKLADHSLLVAKDGSERSISDSAALIRNDDGAVAGLVLVFRDITERRKTERSLAKSLSFADDIIETLRERAFDRPRCACACTIPLRDPIVQEAYSSDLARGGGRGFRNKKDD